jgi:[protein-PII] uridylyltransferase
VSATPADASARDGESWPASARRRLAETDAALAARFDANEDIDRLTRERTRAVDALVREAWSIHIGERDSPALFAVGGYGRGELFPHSDIDLLVLADEGAQAESSEALSAFFAALWDAGLPVGHAVRSAAQCTVAAAGDITVLTAMLEARALCADAGDAECLREAVSPRMVGSARRYFADKRAELVGRHARFGDTADNLEPNLKEGPGGLRDLQTLRWMAMRVPGVPDLDALIALGQLGADEFASLDRERRALSRLRWGLHLVAGKREERLRFDHQKALAARLGHAGDADNLAVEQMMQGFYRSAALVQRIGERLLQRFEEQLEGEAMPEPLDAQFELRRGYLAAHDPDWPHGDPHAAFALFAAWAAHPGIRGLHSHTARALEGAESRIHASVDAVGG